MKTTSMSHLSLLLIPALLGFASCGKPQEDPVAAAETAEALASLEKSKARLEKDLVLLRADFEKRQSEVIHRNEELLKANDSLKAQLEKAQDETTKVRRELETYTAKYKMSLRAKSKGLEIPHLETIEKVAFENVVVRELTPTEVAFSHSGGVARLPLAKLTPALQSKFLYDPEEVKALATAEAEGADAVKDLQTVAGVTQRDPTRPVNALAVRNLTKRIVTREAEILNAENEAKEVKKSSYGNTNIAQYRIKHLGQRVTQLKNDITALRDLLDRELNGPPQSAGGPAPR
jgi:hypothetical protein